MSNESKTPDLASMAAKLGQMIRSNELKVAGKLLATARTTLHQLAEKDNSYQPHYEQVAELRNELMEPGGNDFDEKKVLLDLLNAEKELHKLVAKRPSEPVVMAHTMVKAAAAIVLVYAQDMAGGAPLDF